MSHSSFHFGQRKRATKYRQAIHDRQSHVRTMIVTRNVTRGASKKQVPKVMARREKAISMDYNERGRSFAGCK